MHMPSTSSIDKELLAKARQLTGLRATADVLNAGLAALIAFVFTIMPAACYAVYPRFGLRTLQVLFVLQAGLVIGSAVVVASLHEPLLRGLEAASATARPGELTAFTEGVARQGHYVMTLL